MSPHTGQAKEEGLKGFNIGRATWAWRSDNKPSISPSPITLAIGASFLALFLCLLATLIGTGPDSGWFSLPPDYTPLGWTVRLIGAAFGLTTFTYLLLAQHRQRKQRRRQRRARRYPNTLVKLSLMISAVSIAWEITILAAIVACAVTLIYVMFGENGI